MGKSKSWQCRSCHWTHDASHTSCFWCDKKAASSPTSKPVAGVVTGGGPPPNNRWSKWSNNKRQSAAGGKGAASASNGKGYSASAPPAAADEDASASPVHMDDGSISVDEAKALIGMGTKIPESLRAQAQIVIDVPQASTKPPSA